MDPSAPDTASTSADLSPILQAPTPVGASDAPAARRNAAPLLQVLLVELPARGTILEIGSGTGQHAAAFAAALHPRLWLPTESERSRLGSIRAWTGALPDRAPRPGPPRVLDAATPAETWPVDDAAPISAMVCTNVIHISPWPVALGLLAGAAHWLPADAPLILYGPFRRDGRHTSAGNAAFDADLRREDARWGIRDLEGELVPAASGCGLRVAAVHAMPANNLTVVLRR